MHVGRNPLQIPIPRSQNSVPKKPPIYDPMDLMMSTSFNTPKPILTQGAPPSIAEEDEEGEVFDLPPTQPPSRPPIEFKPYLRAFAMLFSMETKRLL